MNKYFQFFLYNKPKKRLGDQGSHEIKKHEFFSSINWEKLANKDIMPPFLPEVSGDIDLQYIDTVKLYFKRYSCIDN